MIGRLGNQRSDPSSGPVLRARHSSCTEDPAMHLRLIPLLLAALLSVGCGSNGTPADALGVGAQCASTLDCPEVVFDGTDAGVVQLECLTAFTGGYCGIPDCANTAECPEGAICVAHTDGNNYCFRVCANKPECNLNRDPSVESNCSANFVWANAPDDDGSKACIPPSSGTP